MLELHKRFPFTACEDIGYTRIICSSNNKYIAATTEPDRKLSLWDLTDAGKELPLAKELNCITSPPTQPLDWPCSMAFSNNNNYVVAGYKNGFVFVWDLKKEAKNLNPIRFIKLGEKIISVAFDLNNYIVLIGLHNGAIYRWDVRKQENTGSYILILKGLEKISLSGNGEYLLAATINEKNASLYKIPWRAILNRLTFDQMILIIKLKELQAKKQNTNNTFNFPKYRDIYESLPDDIKKTVKTYFNLTLEAAH